MQSNFLRQWALGLLTSGAIAIGLIAYFKNEEKKIGLIDAVKLFNGYKMKAELESLAAVKMEALGREADSLKQLLSARGKAPAGPDKELELLYRQFMEAQQRLEEAFEASNRSINEQVWDRLNPLIDEYGKKAGLRAILGANGMGSVLYYTDYYDHTQQAIDFVNQRYEHGQ